jgi:hypothetical protein
MSTAQTRRRFLRMLPMASAAGLIGGRGTDWRLLNELKRELKA